MKSESGSDFGFFLSVPPRRGKLTAVQIRRCAMNYRMKALALAALMGTGMALGAAAGEAPRQIVASGEGRAEMVPDMVTISVGVSHQDPSAKAAMAKTSEAMARVIARLRDAEIEARDLQTDQLSLDPVWKHSSDSDEVPRVVGFTARNSLSIRLRAPERLGPVLDLVIEDGANTLGGIRFGLQEPQAARDAALRDAISSARAKAELMAEAAGVRLGALTLVTEQSGYGGGPQPMMETAMLRAGPPVAAGEVSISANVTLRYDIAAE